MSSEDNGQSEVSESVLPRCEDIRSAKKYCLIVKVNLEYQRGEPDSGSY